MKKLINKILFTSTLVLSVCYSSCKKDLQLKPLSLLTTNSFWQTKDDATGAATGMYIDARNNAINIYRTEIRSEVYEGGVAGTGADFSDIQANALTSTTPGYPAWTGYYKIINDANLILKYVPNITFAVQADKNQILAEAHAMRAYFYFVMTKVWGDLILRTDPVETGNTDVTYQPRSPQSAIFTLIKQDIEDALNLFPNNNLTTRIRWSKAAVNAFKADVYLFTAKRLNGGTADFNTVITATQQVETADTQLLPNFADIFKFTNKGNKEIIMAFRNEQTEGGSLFMHYTWFNGSLPASAPQSAKDVVQPTGQGQGLLVPTKLVRDQFVTDDSRRAGSFLEIYYPDNNGVQTYLTTVDLKFSGQLLNGSRFFYNDAILYRLADVILMRAEAKNALGQDPSAEMNKIRQRAFGTKLSSYAFVNGTKDQNDDAILKERLLELMFEGKRWDDLVRFGKAFDIVPNLKSRKGSDYLLLFPITTGTLSLEPLVKQNPGYQ